jgi:hypothetical protein
MCASGFALNWSAWFKNSLTTVEGAEKTDESVEDEGTCP